LFAFAFAEEIVTIIYAAPTWMAPVIRVSIVGYAALVVELTSILFRMGRGWLAAVRNPEQGL
jgi:hypothetical protein